MCLLVVRVVKGEGVAHYLSPTHTQYVIGVGGCG